MPGGSRIGLRHAKRGTVMLKQRAWFSVVLTLLALAIVALLSLPFVLLDWPPAGGWMQWPF
jgi:hypothetical protein